MISSTLQVMDYFLMKLVVTFLGEVGIIFKEYKKGLAGCR